MEIYNMILPDGNSASFVDQVGNFPIQVQQGQCIGYKTLTYPFWGTQCNEPQFAITPGGSALIVLRSPV